ncbi:MAG: trigger factor [Paracoccaceae bacterium]
MQVTETLKEGLKRGYQITVTAAELEAKVTEKLLETQPGIEMKGFRKGKVPLALLRKQFGDRMLGEAIDETVDKAINQHFESTGDRAALRPEVAMTDPEWKQGDDVVVNVQYEALPDVPETDLTAVSLERLVVKATEAEIDEALSGLAKSAQNFEDRPEGEKSQDGDQVVIDFTGKVDGETFDGGSATDYPLVLGSNSFIPGFEEQLVGHAVGDEVAVKVTFPEQYGAAHLAGKEAVFDCVVKGVKTAEEAPVDDELAKKFGAEDLGDLRGQLTARIEAEYAGASRALLKRALLDALDGAVKFDLPEGLVTAEAGQIAHQLWHEENPEVHDHNHDAIEPTDEHRSLAERRVRLGLLLAELGRKNEVEVTDAELTQAVMNQARQYPGQEREFFEFVQQNPQMRQQLQAPIFEDKVVDWIFTQASVSEKPVSKEELEAALKALEEEE